MGRGVGSLVQRRYPHGGTHLANGGLVPLWQAARAPALGLGSGPPGSFATQALLCTTWPWNRRRFWNGLCWLATGGHLPGSASASGRGDPTPVVGSRHRPHHADPDGPILLDHPGGSLDAGTTAHEPSHFRLSDAIALVRRHLWLASEGFSLSDAEPDIWKVPAALYHRLVDSLAYADCTLCCALAWVCGLLLCLLRQFLSESALLILHRRTGGGVLCLSPFVVFPNSAGAMLDVSRRTRGNEFAPVLLVGRSGTDPVPCAPAVFRRRCLCALTAAGSCWDVLVLVLERNSAGPSELISGVGWISCI